jgi:hypothetical protein
MDIFTLDDLLDLSIGSSKRDLVITSIELKALKAGDSSRTKLVLTCEEMETRKQFLISDAYVADGFSNTNLSIKGLWVTLDAKKAINPYTTLGRLLKYYNCGTLNDLLNKKITAYPDHKNYLVALTCDLPGTDAEISRLIA